MISIFKLRFILFSFALISLCSCIKQTSDTEGLSSSNNHIIFYRGLDHNGVLNKDHRLMLSYFFENRYYPFYMKYHVTPKIGEDFNNGYDRVLDYIKEIAPTLDSSSTFILHIHAHGGKDGTTTSGEEELKAKDVLTALKDARESKEPFKRFMIFSESCHSGEFIKQFQELRETNKEYKSLFKEGIYIYSSDAALSTFANYSWNMIIPMLAFLRTLQIEKACSTEDDATIYKTAFEKMEEFEHFKNRLSREFKTCFNAYDNIDFSKTPLFDPDLKTILKKAKDCVKKYWGDSNDFTMNMEFSDEFGENVPGSLRNTPIFPDIPSCKK